MQAAVFLQFALIGSGGVAETAFWTNSNGGHDLNRASVATEVTNETMYRRTIVQHQGRTEEVLNWELDRREIPVHRAHELLHHEYTENRSHPLCAFVKNHNTGEVERWHCKFLVAASGRRSRTLELSGISSTINDSEATWAVGDFDAETDFPDLRRRCPIRTTHGNLMLIPSPEKTLRIYMLLTKEEVWFSLRTQL